jgi:hypothetical protein
MKQEVEGRWAMQYGTNGMKRQPRDALKQQKKQEERTRREKKSAPRHRIVHDSFLLPH